MRKLIALTTILNLISLFVGAITTVLGFSKESKIEAGRLTNRGWIFILLLAIAIGSQASVQIIKDASKQNAEASARQAKDVVRQAYSGWIGAGRYRSGEWLNYNLGGGIPDGPDQLAVGKIVVVGNTSVQYLHVRSRFPEKCLNPGFRADTEVNVLARRALVEILATKSIVCSDGHTEVWLKTQPFFE